MSEADLEEIRKARLAQLKASGGGGGGAEGSGEADQRKQQEADARASILSQILFPDAADRLHRIRMVKESRATEVENRLIFMVRSGQLRERVTEEQLKQLLGAMNESNEKESEGKIVVNRRRTALDDDDDDLEGL